MLEEPGPCHALPAIGLEKNRRKEKLFLTVSPNGRILAIADRGEGDVTFFESGAIMICLAEKTGRLMLADASGRSLVIQCPMLQRAGVSPRAGRANPFFRHFPERFSPLPADARTIRAAIHRARRRAEGQ